MSPSLRRRTSGMEPDTNASAPTPIDQERHQFRLPAASGLAKNTLQLAARGFVADTANCCGVMQRHSLCEQTGEQRLAAGQAMELLQHFRFKRAPGCAASKRDRSVPRPGSSARPCGTNWAGSGTTHPLSRNRSHTFPCDAAGSPSTPRTRPSTAVVRGRKVCHRCLRPLPRSPKRLRPRHLTRAQFPEAGGPDG